MSTEPVLRELAPAVLGVLVRRHGDFDEAEDALQEALLAASTAWPVRGVPDNPTGWLVTAASRRLVETWRRESARRRREEDDARREVPAGDPVPGTDDTLALLVLCCHPSLTPPAQVALTLRAVGGLTTAEIARGLLVAEATVAQRISRAKARIAAAGAVFAEPGPPSAPSACPPCSRSSTASSPRGTRPARARSCGAATSPARPCASPASCTRACPPTAR